MIFRQHSHEGDDTTLTTSNSTEPIRLGRIRIRFGPFGRLMGLCPADLAGAQALQSEPDPAVRDLAERIYREQAVDIQAALETARRIRVTSATDRLPLRHVGITGAPPAEPCTPTRPCEACRTRLATRRKDTPT